MIETFFFVPLINKKFINKAKHFDVDYIVYDLEDAISKDSFEQAVDNLDLIEYRESCFIRPRLDWHNNLLFKIQQQGFNKFIIPKLISYQEFVETCDDFLKINENIELILLVENPKILFELKPILDDYSNIIIGIGLGSHDYCNAIGAKHNYDSYRFAHDFILNIAKSYNIKAVDVASMTINDENDFKMEVKQGFDKGYRAKFILHPKQIEMLKKIEYFSNDEIDFAKKVSDKVDINSGFNAVEVDGKILEKPHIDRIKEILNYISHGFK